MTDPEFIDQAEIEDPAAEEDRWLKKQWPLILGLGIVALGLLFRYLRRAR